MKNPPTKRKSKGSAYEANAVFASQTPVTIMAGAMSSAVIAMGNASLTQSTTTAEKMAASRCAWMLSGNGTNQITTNASTAIGRPKRAVTGR